jgi:outer membrane protein assembly factor BamB
MMFFTCCKKSTEPIGNDKPPPGYQEDIPWPSLADSPWPMYHGDPQSTGRSKYPGPIAGVIEWTMDSLWVKSGVSIGYDHTIHFNSGGIIHGLIAANPDGSIKWNLGEVVTNKDAVSTPLVASDGTIYIGSGLGDKLYAVNSDGTLKWELSIGGNVFTVGMNIGLDGKIYTISGLDFFEGIPALNAINPDGSLDWRMENPDFNYDLDKRIGLSFSPDGKTLFVPGKGPSVFAIDVESQTIKWTFGEIGIRGSVLVDSQGHLYFQSQTESINGGKVSLFCLNPDGSVRWSFAHDNPNFSKWHMADGTMDKDGNYYFALDTLYSLDYDGNLRWKLGFERESGEPLTCDINGTVYLPLRVGAYMAAVSSEGDIIWQVDFTDNALMGQSPAIGNDQRMYVASYDREFVYAIR